MKRNLILIPIAALSLAAMACGITINLPNDAFEVGETFTKAIEVPSLDAGETADLTLNFGAGRLYLQPGAEDALVSGEATYNVEEFNPDITIRRNKIEINQGDSNFKFSGFPNFDDLENTWDLDLGSAPMNLTINAGAFEGDFEFGGLALETLEVNAGASSFTLSFSDLNQVEMTKMRIASGASEFFLYDLANSNASYLDFDGGVGNYILDFSGELQRDMIVDIDAGLSNVEITVPKGVSVTLELDGALTNVNARGDWRANGNTYSQSGEGYSITIRIVLGAGNLELDN